MRAMVYHGQGRQSWEEVRRPLMQTDRDAIVRVDAVTICTSSRETSLQSLTGESLATRPWGQPKRWVRGSRTSRSAIGFCSCASLPVGCAGSVGRPGTDSVWDRFTR